MARPLSFHQWSIVESPSPEELVRWCQRTLPRDTRAFEVLVAQYKQRVFAVAYRLMGNRQDAEDQTQEVFIKIFHRIKDLEDPRTLTSWIYRITTNTCLDALRKQKRRPPASPLVPDDPDEEPNVADSRMASPEAEMLNRELQHCLEGALARLDPPARTVLVLRDVEERPYQEIAQTLGIGLSAVKMRIHRTRLLFLRLLDELCPGIQSPVPVEVRQ
jgi:RNA polymerase sigma-70 factor, ECF subfamily